MAQTSPRLPVYATLLQTQGFLDWLDGDLASSGNSLLSMVMMLAMSLGVAVAGGLLGAFGGGDDVGHLGALTAFKWSFVCVGLVTLTSAAIFAQLEPTHVIPQARVQEADSA